MTAADTNVARYRKESWRLPVSVDAELERSVASSRTYSGVLNSSTNLTASHPPMVGLPTGLVSVVPGKTGVRCRGSIL